jgi:phosphoglycolate phosphatase
VPLLILWDIDGTLVRGKGGRVSVTAFTRALQQASQLQAELAYPKNVAGKTDSQIALETLAAASLIDDAADTVVSSFGVAYLAELELVREKLLEDLLVLPGVPEVLDQLQQLGVTQSLLTGNLEPVARLKLGLAGLDSYVDFELGAYGSDHHDRTCLVPIARGRVRQKLGYAPRPSDIVIVGDTPRDIECARAGGARVVAVATGTFSCEELQQHNPDAVLRDLSDTEAVVATLLRYSTAAEPHTSPHRLEA